MYKILGGDGKEYGPVSAETLRQWIHEGRANAQTRVQADGTADWISLGSLPDFAASFAAPPVGRTIPPANISSGRARTSGLAVTSLVMGVVSFVSCGLTLLLTSPLGLILGLVAMNKIKKSDGQLSGRGLALAGAIVSGVGLLMLPLFAALLLPALAKAKARAQTIQCVNNVKQLSLALRIYVDDNNGTFPAATNWCDAIHASVTSPDVFQCAADRAHLRSGYALNAKLAGLTESKVAPDTVMVFESDRGWNAAGGKELMPARPRHDRRLYVIGFADGSVQQVTEARLLRLRWDPNPAVSSTPE